MGKILVIKGADFSQVAIGNTKIKTRINVVASPSGGGIVSGGGLYNVGQQVQITATPAKGYIFSQWSDGVTDLSRNIAVGTSNKTYTAEFTAIESYYPAFASEAFNIEQKDGITLFGNEITKVMTISTIRMASEANMNAKVYLVNKTNGDKTEVLSVTPMDNQMHEYILSEPITVGGNMQLLAIYLQYSKTDTEINPGVIPVMLDGNVYSQVGSPAPIDNKYYSFAIQVK